MKLAASALVICALLSLGCNKTTTTAPSTTTNTPIVTSNVFSGTLDPLASSFYTFNVTQTVTTTVTLGSLAVGDTIVSVPMALGLGTTDGTNCNTTQNVTASPGFTTQITTSLIAGTYCVKIADSGGLSQTTNFAVRINQNSSPPTSTGQTTTENFPSLLYPAGANAHYFAVNQSGSINVTLSDVTPPTSVGLGLGIANSSNVQCNLNLLQDSVPGAPLGLSASADPGIYCVKIFDLGTLTDRVRFTMTIVHP